ncbi:MAG: hypothetical protein ACH254_21310, partial [Candidatus Thiodiazotropha endolucinida]
EHEESTENELMTEVPSPNCSDLGYIYLTCNSASRFVNNIAQSIKQAFINDMFKYPKLCVLEDGSTESTIVEQEVILVR